MPRLVHNAEIAAIFDQLADLLEIEAADMVAAGEDLAALPAIGEDLAGKIVEIVKSGRL